MSHEWVSASFIVKYVQFAVEAPVGEACWGGTEAS